MDLNIRKPVVSGSFYPRTPKEIQVLLKRYLGDVQRERFSGSIRAVIAPHAGYQFSGHVAAHSFLAIDPHDQFETVIILGPSHYVSFNTASICDEDVYETPLGKVQIAQGMAQELRRFHPHIYFDPRAYIKEHSIEVEIPFLQYIYNVDKLSIVPVVIGTQNLEELKILAEAIATISQRKKTLLVVSSDLSHFHPYEVARKMDLDALETIQRGDLEELVYKVSRGQIEMCGFSAIFVMNLVLRQWNVKNAKILKYANSGDVSLDKSRVVGYGSVIFYDS